MGGQHYAISSASSSKARRRRSTRLSVSSEVNSRKDRIGRIGVASARHADKRPTVSVARRTNLLYRHRKPLRRAVEATGLYNALPGACRHIAASSCAGDSIDVGPQPYALGQLDFECASASRVSTALAVTATPLISMPTTN